MTDSTAASILIVDDDEDIAELLSTVVSAMGNYRAIIALSGREALEKLESDAPDLVLLDIMMEDVDGIEVCRTIKGSDKTSHIPVVAITAVRKNDEDLYNEIMDAGVDEYILKPFTFTGLQVIIKRYLND